jgi:hypothetical protein
MMNLHSKLSVLDQIYTIYDEFANSLDVACQRYCASCCTRNVTLTSLEAYKIADCLVTNGKSELFDVLRSESDKKRFQPLITTNRLAELCMQGKEPPEEENDPAWGTCPLLTNEECPIYPVRPFGCRCFVSRQNCGETGYADVDPFIFSVNNVFLQYIEHIDAAGYSGNLTDMAIFMASEQNRHQYRDGTLNGLYDGLIANSPIKIVLVSPEHREKVEPVLKSLQSVKVPVEK